MQPHRYSRLESLFEDFCTCFNDADTVIVAPVYAAGEKPLPGIDRDHLVDIRPGAGRAGCIVMWVGAVSLMEQSWQDGPMLRTPAP